MRKYILLAVIIAILVVPVATVYAASPFDGPPGLERALEVKNQHGKALIGVPGVSAVAVGYDGNSRPAIIIFTETPGVKGLPVLLEGVPVVVRVSGAFVATPKPEKPGKPPKEPELTPRDRWPRPVPIGVSTGHPDITAGTIGARVKDASGNIYALSNNHVYADENKANIGENVLQPGFYDGGVNPDDRIGTLAAFVPIQFDADNEIDAAIALSSTELLDNATPGDGYGIPRSTPATAYINMKVKKYGRTTGLTKGQVYAINATVNVEYDTGVARFVNQIIISPGTFSAGGDSGSLVVVDGKGRDKSSNRLPVGLLFAGNPLYTIANPIGPVLEAFEVTIDDRQE